MCVYVGVFTVLLFCYICDDQTEHALKPLLWGDPPKKSRPQCYSPISPLLVSTNSPSFRSPTISRSPVSSSPQCRSPPMDASPSRSPRSLSPFMFSRNHVSRSIPPRTSSQDSPPSNNSLSRSPPLKHLPRASSPLRNSLSKSPVNVSYIITK